jgi:hypothetical protein
MKLISLDLSTARTGVAIFEDEKLIEHYDITPDDKLANYLKIKFIVDELRLKFKEVDDIICEGIYLGQFGKFFQVTGFELLARLGGATINEWLNIHPEKYPVVLKANETRPLVGMKASCQKCEVQLWVAKKFGFATQEQIDTFESMIESETGSYKEKEFTKATFKKHMSQISKYIEGECDLDEDSADAVLTGCAFIEAKKQGKV